MRVQRDAALVNLRAWRGTIIFARLAANGAAAAPGQVCELSRRYVLSRLLTIHIWGLPARIPLGRLAQCFLRRIGAPCAPAVAPEQLESSIA